TPLNFCFSVLIIRGYNQRDFCHPFPLSRFPRKRSRMWTRRFASSELQAAASNRDSGFPPRAERSLQEEFLGEFNSQDSAVLGGHYGLGVPAVAGGSDRQQQPERQRNQFFAVHVRRRPGHCPRSHGDRRRSARQVQKRQLRISYHGPAELPRHVQDAAREG